MTDFWRVFLFSVLMVFLFSASGSAQEVHPGCRAEWLPAREVLVHTPGEELFYGVIHPAAALFERPFSSAEAIREHEQWRLVLQRRGLKVHNLRDVLLSGAVDPGTGEAIDGDQLTRLRQLARSAIDVQCQGFPDTAAESQAQDRYVEEVLHTLSPTDLWKLVVLRPVVHLKSTGQLNTGYVASYEVRPVMNLYFCRDQMITTPRGIVLGLMNSEQRRLETEIMSAALDALGYRPIYRVQEPGRLEGGDFLPAGDRVFLGQGLRTNAAAVKQLLEHDVFGASEVVIVKDSWQNQEQMHLDTYFNIAGPRTALLVESRSSLNVHGEARDIAPVMKLTADVYRKRQGGTCTLVEQGIDFDRYLRETLKFQVIPVSADDQLKYGVNVLTVGPMQVIGVDGVSDSLKNRLREAGVETTWIDFSALTGGYGACHCTTQILQRVDQP